jgi:hypothetical protein
MCMLAGYLLCMAYYSFLLCCSMNLDYCMCVFHASLLIKLLSEFEISFEVCFKVAWPTCGWLGMLQIGIRAFGSTPD